ncbi:Cyclin-like [Phytophthora cactorum]|nr:Cyclin-like [Phytophthora cactorum]
MLRSPRSLARLAAQFERRQEGDGDGERQCQAKAPRASARRKTTATTVNSALKRTMAPTAATPSKPKEKQEKGDAAKENVTVKTEVDNQVETVAVKQEVVEETDEAVQVKSEAKKEDTPEVQVPEETEVVAAPRDEYAPRPYMFTFDHRNSCFDEETYAQAVRDIDAPSATVSSHHAKLVYELDTYYRKHEVKYLPEADYIGTVQLDINEKMRTILVDWLVEVGEEYELDSQTFHKALLGCACLMIASKFEEVYGPNVEEFVYISDQTYTADEMLDMEVQVLNALQYRSHRLHATDSCTAM